MFARTLKVERVDEQGNAHPCPIHWIDNFAMRNFTNEAVFDDTLPVGDGLLEAGHRVPLDRLRPAMEEWFRRKGYLKAAEQLRVEEIEASRTAAVEDAGIPSKNTPTKIQKTAHPVVRET